MNQMDSTQLAGAGDVDEIVQYRDLSRLAVASLILGGLSFLAILGPAFWLLPALAILLSLSALRAISNNEANLSGRKVAAAGLLLGLLFGSWAPTQYVTRSWTLYRHARQHAAEWLELLRDGRLYQAHQLHLSYSERQPTGSSLEEYYSRETQSSRSPDGMEMMMEVASPQQRLEHFFSEEPLKTLVELGDRATYRFAGNREQLRAGPDEVRVEERFVAVYEENGQQKELPFIVVMQREFFGPLDEAHWHVEYVLDEETLEKG